MDQLFLTKYLLETGKSFGQNYYDVIPENDTVFGYTPNLPQEKFIEEYYNDQTETFYEGASQEIIQSQFIENAPKVVSRRQLRLALSLSGFDLSIIDNFINSLEGQQKVIALIAWNDSITFERDDALLVSLANSVGFSEYQLAVLFLQASEL